MWKWLIGTVIVILMGWLALRSNKQMSSAEAVIEQSILAIDRAYSDKYGLCGNLANTLKMHANVPEGVVDAIETTRKQGMALSPGKITSTEKGPFQLAKIQARLDLAITTATDSISARQDLREDANLKVILKELERNKEIELSASAAYNDEVSTYNNVLSKFPNKMLKGLFGYRKKYLLNLPDTASGQL